MALSKTRLFRSADQAVIFFDLGVNFVFMIKIVRQGSVNLRQRYLQLISQFIRRVFSINMMGSHILNTQPGSGNHRTTISDFRVCYDHINGQYCSFHHDVTYVCSFVGSYSHYNAFRLFRGTQERPTPQVVAWRPVVYSSSICIHPALALDFAHVHSIFSPVVE